MFSVLQNRADGTEWPKAAQKEPGKKLEKLLKNKCLGRLGARRLPVGFGVENGQEGQFLGWRQDTEEGGPSPRAR